MVDDVHLYLCAVPTLGYHAFFGGIDVHSEDGFEHHLKVAVVGSIVERGLNEREVEGATVGPLRLVLKAVQAVVGHGVQFEGKVLHVEHQVVALTLVEQRIFLLRLPK